MTTNEPGWVEENQLADKLGWVCVKDWVRSGSPDLHWCKFQKGDVHVWKVMPRPGVAWVRARLIDGRYCCHEAHLTLAQALRGEKE